MEELADASFYGEREGGDARAEWEEWDTLSSLSLQLHEVGDMPELEGRGGGAGVGADARLQRGEREAAALRRALAAERARAAAAARAHDARLAELHGVIAELVRRRENRDRARAIPEEESEHSGSEACESSTQPAGELEHDADNSHTDQNDSSSLLSPAELPAPRAEPGNGGGARGDAETEAGERKSNTETSDYIGRSDSLPTSASLDNTDRVDALDSGQGVDIRSRKALEASEGEGGDSLERRARAGRRRSLRRSTSDKYHAEETAGYETSLNLSEQECCRSSAAVLSCAEFVRNAQCCQQDKPNYMHTPSHGRGCGEARARVAARVRLRRTDDPHHITGREISADQVWSAQLVEQLAGEMRAHGDLGEALAAATTEASSAALVAAAARAERLAADARVLEVALVDAKDTAERLWLTCALHESWSVCLCGALRAADRALETYDVLLALAECQHDRSERGAAELVARRLLARLEAEAGAGAGGGAGEPLLSPGPWLQPVTTPVAGEGEWTAACEARLRAHAARLKSETAAVRAERPPQPLHAYSLTSEGEPGGVGVGAGCEAARHHDVELAVLLQAAAGAREERAAALAALAAERARTAALARALAAATAPSAPSAPAAPPARHRHTAQREVAAEPARVHSSARAHTRTRRALTSETDL